MKEHIYSVDGKELRARYYNDRLEIIIDGITHSYPNGPIVKYIRNICNVYLEEYPLDGETIFQQEEDLLNSENSKVDSLPLIDPTMTPVVVIPKGVA